MKIWLMSLLMVAFSSLVFADVESYSGIVSEIDAGSTIVIGGKRYDFPANAIVLVGSEGKYQASASALKIGVSVYYDVVFPAGSKGAVSKLRVTGPSSVVNQLIENQP